MEHPFFINANSNRAEALRWLSIAEKLLNNRDLLGCKSFATRARDSDPTLLQAEQILAIADTLLAGENRINNQHYDWYGILQVPPNQTHDSEFIANQYRSLALMLNPQKNTLSFADQAFRLVVDAWTLLSNPFRKSLYDKELGFFLNLNPDPVASAPSTVAPVQQQQQQPGFNVFSNSTREQQQQQQQQIFFSGREQQQQPASSGQSMAFLNRDPVQPVASMQQQPSSSREQQQQQPMMFFNRDQPPPVTPVPAPAVTREAQPAVTFMPGSSGSISFGQSPSRVEQQQPPLADHQRKKQPEKQNAGSVGNNHNHNISGISIGDVSKNKDKETSVEEPKSEIPSFWTACPYCYHMFEYPDVYIDCTMRCHNCKMAFQAIAIASPPSVVDGKDAYFCCWGFIPLGFSVANWERNRDRATSWSPFSPMFTCPIGGGGSGGGGGGSANHAATGHKSGGGNASGGFNNVSGGYSNVGGSKGGAGHKNLPPRIFDDDEDGDDVLDDDDDVLIDMSDSGGESDEDWQVDKRKKSNSVKGKEAKTTTPNIVAPKQQTNKGNIAKGNTVNSHNSVRLQSGRVAVEPTKKAFANHTRRQAGRIAKDYGKLDLNVEFSNEVEEHPPGMGRHGTGAGRGEDDYIEGNGFFEGLDEFLSSLPILSVVGEDKVKAA